MSDKELENLRNKENKEIISHLLAVQKIIAEKCKRCEYIYGCLGCIFSEGELSGYITEALNQMKKM